MFLTYFRTCVIGFRFHLWNEHN